MDLLDSNLHRLSGLETVQFIQQNSAIRGKGLVKLGNLITTWLILVEVVLSIKSTTAVYIAIQSDSSTDGGKYSGKVEFLLRNPKLARMLVENNERYETDRLCTGYCSIE